MKGFKFREGANNCFLITLAKHSRVLTGKEAQLHQTDIFLFSSNYTKDVLLWIQVHLLSKSK